MDKKQKRTFYFLFFAHIYCLILGWFSGENKMKYSTQYFFHFLTWWCAWNSLLTIAFVLWKRSKKSKKDTFFTQVFSLITMLSNLVSMGIYGTGLIIWFGTSLTTYFGITGKTTKLVPIPNHLIVENGVWNWEQLIKVVRWWFYSPLWHLILPTYFIVWFFRNSPKNQLKKKLKLTIFTSLIMPTTYFLYCFFRSRLGDRKYFQEFDARWPYKFLSSKTMMRKVIGTSSFRFVWKIILVLFWFSLFATLTYFSVKMSKNLKKMLTRKIIKNRLSKKLEN